MKWTPVLEKHERLSRRLVKALRGERISKGPFVFFVSEGTPKVPRFSFVRQRVLFETVQLRQTFLNSKLSKRDLKAHIVYGLSLLSVKLPFPKVI
jgi:hypothetical protein